MQPFEVLKSQKQIGAFKLDGTNPFFSLPLTINGKPIEVEIKGEALNEDLFNVDQFGKLKLALDVSNDGGAMLMSKQLQTTLKEILELETLPELKLVVKSMIYKDRMYAIWPQENQKLVAVKLFKSGSNVGEDFTVEDTAKMGIINEHLKKSKEVSVTVEISCWARRDDDKHELIVGVTPRLREIHL